MNTNIADRRLKMGMTQAETAARAKLSQTTIAHFEGGSVPVQVAGAIRLARTLGISVEDMFGHAAEKTSGMRGHSFGPRKRRASTTEGSGSPAL